MGQLLPIREIDSPQLKGTRGVTVYLPPGYEEGERRYPVLYVHDGQNLFDPGRSYAGTTWSLADALDLQAAEGRPAIAVGIDHGGRSRAADYNPFAMPKWPARASKYLAFLVETLKPRIDADLRTLPGPSTTGLIGSSMGGLVSLYGFFEHPHTFELVAALSPSFWVGRSAIYDFVRRQPHRPGRIYIDNGTAENDAGPMCDLLSEQGYGPDQLLYIREKGGQHNEAAWARRVPAALRFLLGG
jgi:predicted alpha/beta superfamily hydrolase